MGNCTGKQTKDIIEAADIITDVGITLAENNGADVPDHIEEALDKTFDVAGDIADIAIEQERKASVQPSPSQ